MIATIKGTLVEANPTIALVEIGGIGYEVHIPLTTMEKLPSPGVQVFLYTHTVYREDSQAIFGFHAKDERDFFRMLIEKVSGIGPKIALRIMSKLSIAMLKSAIISSDVSLLAKCPGIGAKTAERLIIELKDKVSPSIASNSRLPHQGLDATSSTTSRDLMVDAITALSTLGFKFPDADKAIRRASQELGPNATIEELIKQALG
ncbi:MAG: Holliday junction branch migration protein RuvA [Rhodospirillaceae bacterium]|uniref:Holliday junction branch migration complex subunit RuvA n=1 Tax=Candidatus Moanibacter tarae TaxID=2200854 RepID=A0A2Z4AFB6_9BACT|nr:MAG: Holliday junction ATP-dependent DNA helicase RuvA [Candidatus Moanabacter tarae]MBH66956.1 Holliday junction branch migration protein RuvA [Rhodospirillaceae bacterium]